MASWTCLVTCSRPRFLGWKPAEVGSIRLVKAETIMVHDARRILAGCSERLGNITISPNNPNPQASTIRSREELWPTRVTRQVNEVIA